MKNTAKINQLNTIVKEFKATKSEVLFGEIYEIVRPIVLGVIRDIVSHKDRAFSLDTQEIESVVSFEILLKAIESYNEAKGSFNNWYFGVAKLETQNLIRLQGAKKHSPTNGYVSLYTELNDRADGDILADVIEDKSSDVEETINTEVKRNLLSVLMEEFKRQFPREHAVVMASYKYENDRDKRKDAYMEIYKDVIDNWGTVRTRVSRVKDTFAKFLKDGGYAV